MSLSRSPSPNKGGGWASPGLTTNFDNLSGKSTPRKGYGDIQMNGAVGGSDVSWTTAKARSDRVNGYPSFETKHDGFFTRHARQISRGLPSFVKGAEKEKLGRGRWYPNKSSRTGRILGLLGRSIWRLRLRLLMVLSFILAIILFYVTRKHVRSYQWPATLIGSQLCIEPTEGRHSWVVGANSSLYSRRIRAEASWNGKDRENGPLRETVSRTRRSMRRNGATIWKSST